jgi:hypothetical protein
VEFENAWGKKETKIMYLSLNDGLHALVFQCGSVKRDIMKQSIRVVWLLVQNVMCVLPFDTSIRIAWSPVQ